MILSSDKLLNLTQVSSLKECLYEKKVQKKNPLIMNVTTKATQYAAGIWKRIFTPTI